MNKSKKKPARKAKQVKKIESPGVQRFKHFGRPSLYSVELANEICKRLADGKTLIEICKDEGMPCTTSVYEWREKHKDFADKYTRAREAQAEHFADEIIQISDDGKNDTYLDKDGNVKTDYDVINRSRLRVDARKWHAAKTYPKKYGEFSKSEISGPEGSPLGVQIYIPDNGRD